MNDNKEKSLFAEVRAMSVDDFADFIDWLGNGSTRDQWCGSDCFQSKTEQPIDERVCHKCRERFARAPMTDEWREDFEKWKEELYEVDKGEIA